MIFFGHFPHRQYGFMAYCAPHSPSAPLDADLNKMARKGPQAFAVDPAALAARWATLKQTLGWDDRQCRETIAKCPPVTLASYGNQYGGWMFRSGVTRNLSHDMHAGPDQ
jgi:hypothetical protein